MQGVPPDSDFGKGEPYDLVVLDREVPTEVYTERVEAYKLWGLPVEDAEAIAVCSDVSKAYVRRLLDRGCPPERVRGIVA